MRNAPLVALIAFGVLAGCAKDPLVPQFEIVTPACDDPAPLLGTFDSRAPSFIVVFDDTTNAAAEAARLAHLYGFTPTHVYGFALKGFAAELTSATVAAVRGRRRVCRARWRLVSQLTRWALSN